MKKYLAFALILIFFLSDSCVERIDFESPDSDSQLVVDGMITDEPGPYTVKLSRTQQVYDLSDAKTVTAKAVTIFDDAGNSEVLTEIGPGEYQTSSTGIRGQIGRTYFIRIETFDGKVYESIPEKMTPAGAIENLYWEFEEFQPEDGPTQYRFNFFIDASRNRTGDNLFRWKLDATYLVVTSPEFHERRVGEALIPDPRPCSGYVYQSNNLTYVGPPCTCCTCWVTIPDRKPKVPSRNSSFKRVYIGQVPVDYWIFYNRVHVEANQFSLSERASSYWKILQDQSEGAGSLFQPSIGSPISNIFLTNGKEEVQGFFSATAVTKKSLFLTAADIPPGSDIIVKPQLPLKESCILQFENSTNQKPDFWP
jgi:hypothetical protein